MAIILYSTGCPKCNVLEMKLNSKGIEYDVCKDIDIMRSKGILSAPYLEIDNKLMEFGEAVRWVNNYGNETPKETNTNTVDDGPAPVNTGEEIIKMLAKQQHKKD